MKVTVSTKKLQPKLTIMTNIM